MNGNRSGFFRAVLLVVLILGVVGFFRGWFNLSSTRNTDSGKVDVDLTIDPVKMRQDARRTGEATKEAIEDVKDDFREAHKNATDAEQPNPK